MSILSSGGVYSRTPLTNAALVVIDDILAEGAEQLTQTRKGRMWVYIAGDVVLNIEVQEIDQVLWDCEDDLLALGLLPEPGHYRVSFLATGCSDAADREINRLCADIAATIGGVSRGSRRDS